MMRAYFNHHMELQESILLAFQYFGTHLNVKRNTFCTDPSASIGDARGKLTFEIIPYFE